MVQLQTLWLFFCFFNAMRFIFCFCCFLAALAVGAQEVHFTPLELGNEKGVNQDIIGRMGKHILIYREYNAQRTIALYSDSMLLVRRIELNFLPRSLVKVDFINAGESVYLFYQHVQRAQLYLSVARFNNEVKLEQDPVLLDSFSIDDPRELKPYRLIANANRSKILAYGFSSEGPPFVRIKTQLYDKQLNPVDKSDILIASPDGEEMLREFQLDNNGNLIFFRGIQKAETELLGRADVLIKPVLQDTVKFASIKVNDIAVRDIRLQVDNAGNKIIAAAVYGAGRKLDISGVFSITIDIQSNAILAGNPMPFSDSLREECKVKNIARQATFNDYVIDEIIPYKAGGYAILLERRASEGNRFMGNNARFYSDNMLPPAIVYNGMTGNAPILSYIRSPYEFLRQSMDAKSFIKNIAGNILMVSMDETGNLSELQLLRKEQMEENSSDLISYTTIRTSTGLRFLYNEKEKAGLMPNVVAYAPGGRLKWIPTFRNLLPNYRFMMRRGIQTGAAEMVIPCVSNNLISFARISF